MRQIRELYALVIFGFYILVPIIRNKKTKAIKEKKEHSKKTTKDRSFWSRKIFLFFTYFFAYKMLSVDMIFIIKYNLLANHLAL